jgi:undecaprenyl-diphosphatase
MFETLKMFDRALFLKINSLHSPLMDTFMWGMSLSWHTYLFVLIIAFAFYKKYNVKTAAEFILGCALVVACADFSSNLAKNGVKRYRPSHNLEIKAQIHLVDKYDGGKFGFFSAHTANSFGVTTFVFLCIHWLQRKYKYLLFIYPLLICYSRIYLGVHYPSDIFAGIVVGFIFGCLLYLIMKKYFFKFDAKIH